MIPYGRQDITEEDIQAVVDVLRSDFLTQGPAIPAFELIVKEYCGAKHAVAVNSATSALHIACLALGLGPGDWLWTSPISFVASANCGLYCGAQVDFVDIDPLTYNMSADSLEKKLRLAEKIGRLPKVLVAVHMCGQPCDMEAISNLAIKYGFRIIEDASHAIGASYKRHPVGNCKYSDITVFSFHPVKIITTGEGGMALTNDPNLATRMKLLRSHGITRDPALMTHVPDGPWYYQQLDLGFNYRMTDIQAALGVSQMTRLQSVVDRRIALSRRYDEHLLRLPLAIPWQHPDTASARHLYVIRLTGASGQSAHQRIFQDLRTAEIGVNLHYMPIYLHPYFQQLGFVSGLCPEAERYYREAITLPLYPELTDQQQDEIIAVVTRTLAL